MSQIDAYLRQNGKYQKNESKISFNDIEECLILVTSSFSTQTSYENQTKKSITNKFIQEAMTDFLRHQLEIYFIENKADAEKIAEQVLINKRSRETQRAGAAESLRKPCSRAAILPTGCRNLSTAAAATSPKRELFIVEGDSALGSCQARPGTRIFRPSSRCGARFSTA